MFNQTEPQISEASNHLKHLTESEMLDVLECARKVSARDHALILVTYIYGLRNQEVARLFKSVPACRYGSFELRTDGLKYATLSLRHKSQHLTPPANESGYEHTQTKILAAAVAPCLDVTEPIGNRGNR
jgi:hypothetical protein